MVVCCAIAGVLWWFLDSIPAIEFNREFISHKLASGTEVPVVLPPSVPGGHDVFTSFSAWKDGYNVDFNREPNCLAWECKVAGIRAVRSGRFELETEQVPKPIDLNGTPGQMGTACASSCITLVGWTQNDVYYQSFFKVGTNKLR